MNNPMTWSELCASNEFRGRWVALDQAKYDEATAKPIAGTVIDADDSLVALCARIRASGSCGCAILFIEEGRAHNSSPPPPSVRAMH